MALIENVEKWRPMVQQQLSKIGFPIPADVILAVIQIESRGESGIVNPKSGASGLMQVMPITVKDYNQRHGTSYTIADMRNAENPAIQLQVGIATLARYWMVAYRYLLKRVGHVDMGDLVRLADLFFAAGPGAAKKLINKIEPTWESIKANLPNWAALPHTEKLVKLIEGVQFDLAQISPWLESARQSLRTVAQKSPVTRKQGAALALVAIGLAYWYFGRKKHGDEEENEDLEEENENEN